MAEKLQDRSFVGDMAPLLRTGLAYDAAEAWRQVHSALITLLPGDPWKGLDASD